MTQLQKIVAKAKTLKKSYPNAKWTDLIKKASKLVTPAKKSVGAVKKLPARSMHKDTKSHNVNIRVMSGTKKRSTSRSAESEKIRATVKKNGFIMPHGYQVTKSKRISGYVGALIIKKYTLTELKKLNPIYFEKGADKLHGVYKRKLMISNLLQSQVMIEAYKVYFPSGLQRFYGVRKIESNGRIESPKYFDTLLGASNYIGKNIIL